MGIDAVHKVSKPTLIKDLEDKTVVQVGCGTFHTVVLTEDSELYSAGLNDFGQLGVNMAR